METYQKIESVFNRDKKTFKFIDGEWRLPVFEYLANNLWDCTEKLHGMNVRVMWDCETVRFGGKTDRAQMPARLLSKLAELFPVCKFVEHYPNTSMCLYMEGIGIGIQKGGSNYVSDGVDVAIFDVLIDTWWLKCDDILDVASKLGVPVVPSLGPLTLLEAVDKVKDGITSIYGDFEAEGVVLRPQVGLVCRNGQRILAKIKAGDFI